MAFDPSVNYAKQFEDTFRILTQTQGGKFGGKVYEKQYTNADEVFYEQLGAVSEDDRDVRFSRTNYKDIARFRRKLFVEDKNIALQIDKPDENRTLADVRSPYVQQTAAAYARSKDIFAIKGALGVTYGGKNGTTANDFDWTNQLIDVQTGGGGSNTGMNLEKLLDGKQKFWDNDVDIDDPRYKLHIALTGKQLREMLNETEVTSADYNTVKALVNGDVDQFCGVTFVRSELLPFMNTAGNGVQLVWGEDSTYGYRTPTDVDSTDIRACFMWAKEGVCVATNKSYKIRAEELQDYNYNFGIYTEWGIGSMRHEEKHVVALPCDQSPA